MSQLDSEILQAVADAKAIEDLFLGVSYQLGVSLGVDRFTVSKVSADGLTLFTKILSGRTTYRELHVPINEVSLLGFCAVSKRLMNIRYVYDEDELRRF